MLSLLVHTSLDVYTLCTIYSVLFDWLGGGKGGSSSKHTSAKVALMKLKMRSVGLASIPQVCSGVVAGEVSWSLSC